MRFTSCVIMMIEIMQNRVIFCYIVTQFWQCVKYSEGCTTFFGRMTNREEGFLVEKERGVSRSAERDEGRRPLDPCDFLKKIELNF